MKYFISTTTLLLFILIISTAYAADSGAENVVEVQEYKCLACDTVVFTFCPDDIDADLKKDYKDANYQDNNWLTLKDPGRSFIRHKPCRNGGHIFDKRGSAKKVSPEDVYKNIEKFIVLKNGGALNTSIQELQCVGCGKSDFWSFMGDDLDQFAELNLTIPQNVWNIKNGSRIPDCNTQYIKSLPAAKTHLFKTKIIKSTKSYDLGKISSFYYSK